MYYDLLAKIKNAGRAKKESFQTPFSKFDFAVAKLLVAGRYIKEAERRNIGKRSFLEITLRYEKGQPAMSDFRIVSKPSRRLYVGYRDLRSVKQGYGTGAVSTPVGILTVAEAKKRKVGGEYLFEIW